MQHMMGNITTSEVTEPSDDKNIVHDGCGDREETTRRGETVASTAQVVSRQESLGLVILRIHTLLSI